MRLNLGAGGQTADGWTSVDRAGDVHVLLDLVADPWPWEKDEAEGIVLHHVLDLLSVDEMFVLLRRCHETLQLGAVLRISGANLALGIAHAINGDRRWFAEPRTTLEETVGFFITQGGARRQYATAESVIMACQLVGFPHAFVSDAHATMGPEWITELDSREQESWFVEAIR